MELGFRLAGTAAAKEREAETDQESEPSSGKYAKERQGLFASVERRTNLSRQQQRPVFVTLAGREEYGTQYIYSFKCFISEEHKLPLHAQLFLLNPNPVAECVVH